MGRRQNDIKRTESLKQRLTDDARRSRDEAHLLPPGQHREKLLRRVRQDETAIEIEAWLNSPGLRAPT
nr:hypothetical protein [Bradyrhizobium liaoningense]